MSRIIEAIRHIPQGIHEFMNGDASYAGLFQTLSIRDLPFDERWEKAKQLTPYEQREFIRLKTAASPALSGRG